MQQEPAFAREALGAGALGYVLKEAADDELVEAVRNARRGQSYLNPRLGARIASEPPPGPPDDLSEREVEVLRLIALGHTNAEIAEQLFLSVRTVETHRSHIQQKLQALHPRRARRLRAGARADQLRRCQGWLTDRCSWVPPALRLPSLSLFERAHARQRAALQKLERRAAARGEMGDAILKAIVAKRLDGLTSARDGEPRGRREGLGDGTRPVREHLQLKDAHRTVPEHTRRFGDRRGKARRGAWPDVERRSIHRGPRDPRGCVARRRLVHSRATTRSSGSSTEPSVPGGHLEHRWLPSQGRARRLC